MKFSDKLIQYLTNTFGSINSVLLNIQSKLSTNEANISNLTAAVNEIEIPEIVDALTSTFADKTLSANQGRILYGFIQDIQDIITSDDVNLDEFQEIVNYIKQNKNDLQNLSISNIAGLQAALNGKEAAFSKNTGFNRPFGTGSNDVARGNDSRFHEHANKSTLDNINDAKVQEWDGKATQQDIDDSIEAVEIGGRNYFSVNDHIEFSQSYFDPIENGWRMTNKYAVNVADLTEIFEPNTLYTVSGIINPVSGTDSHALGGSMRLFKTDSYSSQILSKNASSYTFFTPNDLNGGRLYIYGSETGVYDFSNIKIEKGNKATDWTPNPEDKANENEVLHKTGNADKLITGNDTEIPVSDFAKSSNNFKTFFSVSEIGLTKGSETIQDIVDNLPQNTQIYYSVGAPGWNESEYPNPTRGTVLIRKAIYPEAYWTYREGKGFYKAHFDSQEFLGWEELPYKDQVATAAQGTKADNAIQPNAGLSNLTNDLKFISADFNNGLGASAIVNSNFLADIPEGTYVASVSNGNTNLPFNGVGGLISFGSGALTSRILGARDGSDNLWFSSGAVSNPYWQVASRAWVNAAIANLIDSSPETLDTLNELAEALGNDPNFATTVFNQIGQKLEKGGYTGTAQDLKDAFDSLVANYNALATVVSGKANSNDSRFHTHANKAVLDAISQAKINAWDASAGKKRAVNIRSSSSVYTLQQTDEVVFFTNSANHSINGTTPDGAGKPFWLVAYTPKTFTPTYIDSRGNTTSNVFGAVQIVWDGENWRQVNNRTTEEYFEMLEPVLVPIDRDIIRYSGTNSEIIPVPAASTCTGCSFKLIFTNPAKIDKSYINTNGTIRGTETDHSSGEVLKLYSDGINWMKIN